MVIPMCVLMDLVKKDKKYGAINVFNENLFCTLHHFKIMSSKLCIKI